VRRTQSNGRSMRLPCGYGLPHAPLGRGWEMRGAEGRAAGTLPAINRGGGRNVPSCEGRAKAGRY